MVVVSLATQLSATPPRELRLRRKLTVSRQAIYDRVPALPLCPITGSQNPACSEEPRVQRSKAAQHERVLNRSHLVFTAMHSSRGSQ